jgi:hypothetical protein
MVPDPFDRATITIGCSADERAGPTAPLAWKFETSDLRIRNFALKGLRSFIFFFFLHARLAAKNRQARILSKRRRYLACAVPQASRVQGSNGKTVNTINTVDERFGHGTRDHDHGSPKRRRSGLSCQKQNLMICSTARVEFGGSTILCRIRDGCCVGKSFLKQHQRAGVATDFGYDHRG